MNTYDGKLFMRKSGSVDTVIEIGAASVSGPNYYVPIFSGSNALSSSAIFSSGSFTAINYSGSPEEPNNPDILYVSAENVDTSNIISAHGNQNDYVQVHIQNYSNGISASSDIVAVSDVTSSYIDLGINSSNYTNTLNVGSSGDGYMFSTGNDLYIGNTSVNKKIIIFNGGFDAATYARVYINPQGTVGINTSTVDISNPAALVVRAINTTTYNLMLATSQIDNYSQLNIQNQSNGAQASSDIVATADNGDETRNYIDMGINSSGFSNPSLVGGSNDAYIYSTGKHLHIGNVGNNDPSNDSSIYLFAGGSNVDTNTKIYISGSTTIRIGIGTLTPSYSLDVSGSMRVTNGVTASLYGTASWAQNATTSSYALTASYVSGSSSTSVTSSYALTASYVANALTASYFLTSSVTFAATASWATSSLTASYFITSSVTSASFATTASYLNLLSQSLTVSGGLVVTGSVRATSFTGSIFGTASWASSSINAQTASYFITNSVTFAATSSWATSSLTASYFITSSVTFASTASFATSSLTASYFITSSVTSASFSATASYLNLLSQSLTVSGGLVVTGSVRATSFTGSIFGTSSWASSSVNAQTASYFITSSVTFAATSSWATSSLTASYFITSSVTYASTASFATSSLTASYFITSSVTSASYAATASNVLGGAANYVALWSSSTSLTKSIVYQDGKNIGINNPNPQYSLDVNADNGYVRFAASSSDAPYAGFVLSPISTYNSEILIQNKGYGLPKWSIRFAGSADGTAGDFYFQKSGATDVFHIYDSTNNVNIGAASDLARLTIKGGGTTNSTKTLLLQNATPTDLMSVYDNGNIVIGSNSDAGYKLDVSGSSGRFQNGLIVSGALTAPSITGSLFGTSSWSVSSSYAVSTSYATTASNLLGGTNNYIAMWTGSTSLTSSLMYQSQSSVVVNSPILFTGTPSYPGIGSTAIYHNNTYGLVNTGSGSLYDLSYFNGIGGQVWGVIANTYNSEFFGTLKAVNTFTLGSVKFTDNSTYGNTIWGRTGNTDISVTITNDSGQVGNGYGFYYHNNANVSIGTQIDSGYKLDVSGSGRFINGLSVTGSLGAPNITGSLQGTSSWALNAITASYVLNAPSSTTFPYTGSAVISGSLSLTGSLSITGSTTQIGNNNLLGQTFLSGSITISGSISASANMSLGGWLRLDPSLDPGSNNITASYLFTSASNTQTGYDLYYRQDGNLIKFKWLEGGVSTGILEGGVISGSGTTIYVSPGTAIINTMNASTSSEINPIITYVRWNPYTASVTYLTSSQNTYLFVDNTGAIFQQTSFFDQTQYTQAIPLGRVTHANYTSITGVGSNVQTTYDNDSQQNDFIRAFGPIKVNGFTPTGQSGSLRLNIGGGTAFNLGGFYPQDPNQPSHYTSTQQLTASMARAYRSGSIIYQDNNAGAFYTVVDPTKYDDGTGILNSVPGGNFTIQRIFFNPVTKRCTVYYGQNTYNSISTALANLPSDSFTEGEFTAKSLVFAGYLIIQSGASDLSDPTQGYFLQAGIFRNIAGGSSGAGTVAQRLDDLSDVVAPTPSNGQALVYNAGVWINSNPTSASYSSTASYAANGGVTQIIAGTNVTISPTNGLGAVTISSTAASSGGGTNTTSSFTNLSTWTFNHNLNSQYVVIQTTDSNGNQIIPQNIALTNANTATITFPTPESGIAIASLGGVGTSAATASYVAPYETAWTAYTPVWTAASSNPVIGNGTIVGYYKLIGKTCFVRGNVAMGSTTTFGSGEWYISMPFTASNSDGILMTANLLDNTTAWYNATVNGARAGFNYKSAIQYQNTGGTADSIASTTPFTWTNSDRFIWNGSYEIQ